MIRSTQIDSWSKLEGYIEKNFSAPGRWVFRGHEDSDWTLSTRLERELLDVSRSAAPKPCPTGIHGEPVEGMRERIELYFFRAFQARAVDLTEGLPRAEDTLSWLSMMQHWGFPTRLLDVTTSPSVALHFAVAPHLRTERLHGKNAALFAIHTVPLRRLASESLGVEEIDFSQPEAFRSNFFQRAKGFFAVPVHPSIISERMAAQQGTFLCPTTIYESFERCLLTIPKTAKYSIDHLVQKLILTDRAIEQSFGKLTKMNIHEASLFPDIHGYARFLSDNVQKFKRSKSRDWIVEFESLERLKWPG